MHITPRTSTVYVGVAAAVIVLVLLTSTTLTPSVYAARTHHHTHISNNICPESWRWSCRSNRQLAWKQVYLAGTIYLLVSLSQGSALLKNGCTSSADIVTVKGIRIATTAKMLMKRSLTLVDTLLWTRRLDESRDVMALLVLVWIRFFNTCDKAIQANASDCSASWIQKNRYNTLWVWYIRTDQIQMKSLELQNLCNKAKAYIKSLFLLYLFLLD